MRSESRLNRFVLRHSARTTLGVLVLLYGLMMACGADSPSRPEILVENAWSRPAVAMDEMPGEASGGGTEMGDAMGSTGAVFMKLVNKGQESDRLIGGQTHVAEVVEIHETRVEGDVMTMHLLPDGVIIPAGGEVELKPGGYHMMLIGLKQALTVGERLSMVLDFEKSDSITVTAEVREMGD